MLLGVMTNADINRGTPDAPQGTDAPVKLERTPLMDIKNGKAALRQKLVSYERMSETMQEIVKCRGFIQQLIDQNASPLHKLPDEHLPLIAKLVHESDKTLVALAKHIQTSLQPEQLDEGEESEGVRSDVLPLSVIESAITSIADRVNYGVDWVEKPPASLCVWRWELKEKHKPWLPKSGFEKFATRISERRQAHEDLRSLIENMPVADRDSLLKTSKKSKGDTKFIPFITKPDQARVGDENKPAEPATSPQKFQTAASGSQASTSEDPTHSQGRPKKPADPEREAKEKEKAEKRAAKAEKERKEKEAQNKSRSLMSAFFKKPKQSKTGPSPKSKPSSSTSTVDTEAGSSSVDDFAKTFKPFAVRKDATLAPINWFQHQKRKDRVIVIDADSSPTRANATEDVEMRDAFEKQEPLELLRSLIQELMPNRRRVHLSSNLKSTSKYCVRTIVSQLSEAEVIGDTSAVRRLTKLLASRSHIPAKVLIFHDDTRPGYFGTFTKSSASVGPRTPFAKDAITFDYSYDSGAEWEEEEEGGDDLMSLDGTVEDGASDAGSELDDWLVDDDDDVDPGTPLSERARSPSFPLPELPVQSTSGKRKSATGEKKEQKKRKVIPLVPFTKGPYLEKKIGKCEYDVFNNYRIQFFNDTPFPIDPFTFVTTMPTEAKSTSNAKSIFVVPAVPARLQKDSSSTLSLPSSSTSTVPAKRKPATALQPKTPFPDALLPVLADKIASLATGNLNWLIESAYQDLRAHVLNESGPSHKVTKVAVEAKVREIGEKCRVKKVWVVKEDVLRAISAQIRKA